MKIIGPRKRPLLSAPWLVLYSVAVVAVAKGDSPHSGMARPFALTCGSWKQSLDIDSTKPPFSWKLRDDRSGAKETADETLVSSELNPAGLLNPNIWDGGSVSSEQSVNITYAGKRLTAETRHYRQVRVRGQNGKLYRLSMPTWSETGLMTCGAYGEE